MMGTGSCFQGESSWGMALTTHPLLLPWLSIDRAIPTPPLCIFRACYKVFFTITFTVSLERAKYTVILQYTVITLKDVSSRHVKK
jgi:hypothetical protein